MESLGSRLKKAREDCRLTQMEAASKVEISNGTLSGYERNYRDPDTETLKKLANLYSVSIDWLLYGREMKEISLVDKTKMGQGVKEQVASYDLRDYEGIMKEIKDKYPGVDLNDPDVRRKLMKAIDLVLDDYEKRR